MIAANVLDVDGLSVVFPRRRGVADRVVDEVSLSVAKGEVVGLVGESGSGKTMVGLSVMGLVPSPGRVSGRRLGLDGHEVLAMTDKSLRRLRGKDVAMIFQDPLSAMNPVRPIASAFLQSLRRHCGLGRREALERAVDSLKSVGIANARERLFAYPHQFSGGQRQRLMIALALINNPVLLIADEPTTALDTTIQAQILDLLKHRMEGRGAVLITHDLGVAAELCEHVAVMRKGRIVEAGTVDEMLRTPQDPYTRDLIDAVPRFDRRPYASRSRSMSETRHLLEVRDLTVTFDSRAGGIRAVDGVDLDVGHGESVGIVGESGSGKSTLVKAIMRIVSPSSGRIRFNGRDLELASRDSTRSLAAEMQLVFQDPYASLDPHWTVGRIIGEPLHVQRIPSPEIAARVAELIEQVGLPSDSAKRLPAEFSGGQRQRVALARALILKPKLVIADEPVSSLDVTVQKQVATLLRELKNRYGIALLLVAHDLPLVYQLTERVIVLYMGQVVEVGPTSDVLKTPAHPYTAALISATPTPEPGASRRRIVLAGEPSSAFEPPGGCPFHPRCPAATDKCRNVAPALALHRNDVRVACHYPGTLGPTPSASPA